VEPFERWTDRELWLRAGDQPEAFGELFQRHARAVYVFCARRTADLAVAEDLVSVVFLEAWRRRRSIEIDGASALPWLLGSPTTWFGTPAERAAATVERLSGCP
jgi:RNA polymerase sigma-70 factor (ECF subfamily)